MDREPSFYDQTLMSENFNSYMEMQFYVESSQQSQKITYFTNHIEGLLSVNLVFFSPTTFSTT